MHSSVLLIEFVFVLSKIILGRSTTFSPTRHVECVSRRQYVVTEMFVRNNAHLNLYFWTYSGRPQILIGYRLVNLHTSYISMRKIKMFC